MDNQTFTPVKIKRRFTLKLPDWIRRAINQFSLFEKTVFYILCVVMIVSAGAIILNINNLFTKEIPLQGGSLHEGIIGSARFINPILANSDSDRDLTSLVYSGLTRSMPDGSVIPDLAESYKIEDDGKTYTFLLKENINFHDGKPITTDDVEFTILQIQDPLVKSPKRANWDSVSIEKINPREIKFHLRQAYTPFLENTTIGIVPKYMWKDLTPEQLPFSLFNAKPIGSGPYVIKSIENDSSGLPKTYTLSAFKDFALGRPFIDSVMISFFPNEDELLTAFESGKIDNIHSIATEKLTAIKRENKIIVTAPLPRIFGVFFNQNQATLFVNQKVREALNVAIDKEKLVKEVLGGYGVVINSPLLSEIAPPLSEEKISEEERIAKARNILTGDGWVYNEEEKVFKKTIKKSAKVTETQVLSFSLSTGNISELKTTANMLKEVWERVGAKVDVKIFESGDLNQTVIRPRKYDSLLFGEVIGRDLDFFAFWHSSQRNDPGLNIANYTNSKVDKILEEARSILPKEERVIKYQKFSKELMKETPSIFLYSPEFIYINKPNLKGMELKNITIPSDRFIDIYKWFIETEKVWKIFNKQ
ncbi:MAG: ABC transporter substrate-binding protein [Patescibacteria group bacterium]